MWEYLLLLGAAAIVLTVALTTVLVPAKRKIVLRDMLTQQKRILHEGLQWAKPWEVRATLRLPTGGAFTSEVYEFMEDPNMYYRYDPPPYRTLTQDQVEVFVDVWVRYKVDVNIAVDFQSDFSAMLDDCVRAMTQKLVSTLIRKDINARHLSSLFDETAWPALGNGITIDCVGVQEIHFDARMQALLGAQSAGMTAEAALEHVRRADLLEAMRQDKHAPVVIGPKY